MYGPHVIEITDDTFFAVIAHTPETYWQMMYARFCYLMETCFA